MNGMIRSLPANRAKVLIVSDDPETARIWSYCLSMVGAEAVVVDYSCPVLQIWAEELPEMILIESINRSNEELELVRKLRLETPVPIILLPSGDDESQIYEAYRAGVDECMTPPVSPRLFLMKVRSWLRRVDAVPSASLDELKVNTFRLDPSRRMLYLDGCQEVKLTSLESRLLYVFLGHPGSVLESDFLVERVWGPYGNGDTALLKNLVYRLRRKIEPNPSQPVYLLTEASSGYRFTP